MSSEIMYKTIYNELLDDIKSGRYGIGSRLPSEKELAEAYNVSRITSKKALEMLSDRGYVVRKPGKGTFVMNKDAEDNTDDESGTEKPEVSRSMTCFGVIMDSLSGNFGGEILLGLEYECRRRGILMMFRLTNGSLEEENRAVADMIKAGVSGLIVMPVQKQTFNPELIRLHMNGFPIILLDREIRGMDIPVITTDNYKASCELTQCLIDKGHTRIGFISNSNFFTSTVEERFSGFRDTLLAAGLQHDESMWIRNLNAFLPSDDEEVLKSEGAATQEILNQFIDDHSDITAYFAMEYTLALKVYELLYQRGLSRDLVFFDGYSEDLPEMKFAPRFVHCLQGQYEMGVTAVRTLVHKLRGEEINSRINIPYHIVGREE